MNVTVTRRWLCFKWSRTILVPLTALPMSDRELKYHMSNQLGRN